MYFDLVDQEKKSYIKGAEFGKGIFDMVSKHKHLTTESLMDELYGDLKRLEQSLRSKGINNPCSHKSYLTMSDNVELTSIIASKYDKALDVMEASLRIFSNDGEGIALMTIHKSKGLEADRVFILRPDLIPSKFAKQDWELEQENKLLFVAYSRAKKSLIFLR